MLYKKKTKGVGKGWKKYDLPILDETQWAYFAGIFDGEGSIAFLTSKNGYKIPRIDISNVNLELIETLQQLLKTGNIYKMTLVKNRQQCYHFYIQQHKAIYLILSKFLPYLIVKRSKTIETLNFIKDKEVLS